MVIGNLFACYSRVLHCYLLLLSLNITTTHVHVILFIQIGNIEIKETMTFAVPSLWLNNDFFPNGVHFYIHIIIDSQVVRLLWFFDRNYWTLSYFDSLIDFERSDFHLDVWFLIVWWMNDQRSIRMWNFQMTSQVSSVATERLLSVVLFWIYVTIIINCKSGHCLSSLIIVLSNIDDRNSIKTNVLSNHFNLRILKIRYLVIFLFEICIILNERRGSLSVIIFGTKSNLRFYKWRRILKVLSILNIKWSRWQTIIILERIWQLITNHWYLPLFFLFFFLIFQTFIYMIDIRIWLFKSVTHYLLLFIDVYQLLLLIRYV